MMDNTWATPLYFRAARPRRRHLDPSRRPNIRPAIPTCCSAPSRPTRRAGSGCCDTFVAMGCCAGPRRRLPGAARPAHDGRAARTASDERAADRPLAGSASPAWRACCIPDLRATRATRSGSATSPGPAAFSPSCSRAAARGGACLSRRAADLRPRLFLGRLREPRGARPLADRTIAKAPPDGPLIRLQIGLEDVEDLIEDLKRGLDAAASLSVTGPTAAAP